MKKHLISSILLIIYGVLMIKIMVFRSIPMIRIGHMIINIGGADANGQANFMPFKSIVSYLFVERGFFGLGVNIIGNIFILIPFGFLFSLVFKNITWRKSLALAIIIPLIIEILQVLLHTGIFDIDDVILNALGYMIGYWIFLLFKNRR